MKNNTLKFSAIFIIFIAIFILNAQPSTASNLIQIYKGSPPGCNSSGSVRSCPAIRCGDMNPWGFGGDFWAIDDLAYHDPSEALFSGAILDENLLNQCDKDSDLMIQAWGKKGGWIAMPTQTASVSFNSAIAGNTLNFQAASRGISGFNYHPEVSSFIKNYGTEQKSGANDAVGTQNPEEADKLAKYIAQYGACDTQEIRIFCVKKNSINKPSLPVLQPLMPQPPPPSQPNPPNNKPDPYQLTQEQLEKLKKLIGPKFEKYLPTFEKYCEKYHVPITLAILQFQQESGFNPKALSWCGAMGIAQFMPETWSGLQNKIDDDGHGASPWSPYDSIANGIRYMSQMYQAVGDANKWNVTLATYNAGLGAVQKYGNQVPPYSETQNYVHDIMHNYNLINIKKIF